MLILIRQQLNLRLLVKMGRQHGFKMTGVVLALKFGKQKLIGKQVPQIILKI